MRVVAAAVRALMVWAVMIHSAVAEAQQPYPNRAVRLIVPYSTGGGADALARLVTQKLSEMWGQPIVVDNRPGGNTMIGTEAALKSPADGYTLMFVSMDQLVVANLFPPLLEILRHSTPVATLSSNENMLVANSSVPVNNLQDIIALAKSKPGQLNYATVGGGGWQRLAGELFAILADAKMQDVPYKAAGSAIADLLGGQVQLYFTPPLPVIPHIKTGKLKPIAVTGDARLQALPDVPTFAEAGLPGLDIKLWYGILAPKGTPKPIVDKVSADIAKIMNLPDVKERLADLGTVSFVSTPEQFDAVMKADLAKFEKIIKTANLKLE